MNDDQFTQLFKGIQDLSTKVDNAIENMATKDDINEIYNRLDDIAARLDEDDTERVAIASQVDRHDTQIHEIADRIGLRLTEQS